MTLWKSLACAVWVALSSVALADNVTPSDRVETRLRIRGAPEGQSQIVGHLFPGASLPLRSSIPNWYEVTLPGGQRGFVSKAWATVITVPTLSPADADVRIGSWNVRKLGHGPNKNFDLVAQIIESHFNIVAIVEVMQKGGGHPGYDSLVAELGAGI